MRLLCGLMLVCWMAAMPAWAVECRKDFHLGSTYSVCLVDPAREHIRIFASDPSGKPYGRFRVLAVDLWQREKSVLTFAVNGGMFHADLNPVGLFVARGETRHKAVMGPGEGNFHLLPNGVFYLRNGHAGVLETHRFQHYGIRPDYATQSGPMLVIDGRVHPAFLPDSDSLKVRNGVGIDGSGRAVFVMSDGPVRFHDLATFYRDRLGCKQALFLDGSISSLHWPGWKRSDWFWPLGTIIAVTRSLP